METIVQGIQCFGTVEEDSNFHLVGDYKNGDEMDDTWLLDGWEKEEPPKDWKEVVDHIKAWADRDGHKVMEIHAI